MQTHVRAQQSVAAQPFPGDTKRNILVSAGGTATAWHLASLISTTFASFFNLYVCDIYPSFLIPASQLAHGYLQVPLVAAPHYREQMLSLLAEHQIDIFVPLIDDDVEIFPSDSEELARLGIRSTGCCRATAEMLANKRVLSEFLSQHGLPVPETLSSGEVAQSPDRKVFIKPEHGFGSKQARQASAQEALWATSQHPGLMIQSLCSPPEITVEVLNCGSVKTLCRERLQTKAGVCTKARIYSDSAMQQLAERLCALLELPIAFCFQVMCGAHGQPVITDVNPRLGAGTALSTAYGWSLASAALVCWAGLPLDPLQFLRVADKEKYVVRVYQERVMD